MNKDKLVGIGAVITALLAASCCIGPLLLAGLGVGSLGFSAGLAKYRPEFLGLTFALLAAAFYRAYRPAQAGDACCTTQAGRRAQRRNRAVLWMMAFVAVGLAAYPEIASYRAQSGTVADPVASRAPGALLAVARYSIPSMDCPACAVTIQNQLRHTPGVLSASVHYDKKTAKVRFDARRLSPAQIQAKIDATGFKAVTARPIAGS